MQLHNSRVINTFISHKQSYTLYFYSAALSNTHISNLRQRFIYPIPRIFLFNLSCHHTRSLTERETYILDTGNDRNNEAITINFCISYAAVKRRIIKYEF